MKLTSGILISASITMLLAGCETPNSVNRTGYSPDSSQQGISSRYGYLADAGVGGQGQGGQGQGSRQDPPASNRYGSGSAGVATGPSAPVTGGNTSRNPGQNPGSNSSGNTGASSAKKPNDRPYADPVPGKYGRVYSPFARGKEIDVADFSPGTLVRCPYTQKIFRVP